MATPAPTRPSHATPGSTPARGPVAAGTSRFDTCRCALHAAPAGAPRGAPPEPIAYRRCPVGVIADVDCPEFVGARCVFHDDRAGAPPVVVPRAEVPLLAAELSADYLTPRYRRRVARLRGTAGDEPRGADLLAASPVLPSTAPTAAPVRRRALVADAPVNVPADRDGRRPRAGKPAGSPAPEARTP